MQINELINSYKTCGVSTKTGKDKPNVMINMLDAELWLQWSNKRLDCLERSDHFYHALSPGSFTYYPYNFNVKITRKTYSG